MRDSTPVPAYAISANSTNVNSVQNKVPCKLEVLISSVDCLIIVDSNEAMETAASALIGAIGKKEYVSPDLEKVLDMMRCSGVAVMGYGSGNGENRIDHAMKEAMDAIMLKGNNLKNVSKLLLNVTCSKSDNGITMGELKHLQEILAGLMPYGGQCEKGVVFSDDPDFGDRIEVTLFAIGVLKK